MALSPNYGWAEPDNSSLVKNGAQDIRALGDAIDTSLWNVGFGQAGKNKIINGDFGIWQRGTSFTPAASTDGLYNTDRFSTYWIGTGTTTISRQSFTAGAAPVAGYENQYYWQAATGTGATYLNLGQKIENVRTFAGQTVTLSFWAKATSSVSFTPTIRQGFGSGGSADVDTVASAITLTSSWVRYSSTLNVPSVSGKTIGTSSSLGVFPLWSSGGTIASNTIQVWGVQLEYGSKATPFETATGTIQGELAACQRYYQRLDSSENNFTPFMFGAGTSTTNIRFFANTPVTMRTSGNVTVSAFSTFTTGNGNAAITAVGGGFMRNKNTLLLDMTTNSATVQRSAYSLEANNSAVASIQIDSEL